MVLGDVLHDGPNGFSFEIIQVKIRILIISMFSPKGNYLHMSKMKTCRATASLTDAVSNLSLYDLSNVCMPASLPSMQSRRIIALYRRKPTNGMVQKLWSLTDIVYTGTLIMTLLIVGVPLKTAGFPSLLPTLQNDHNGWTGHTIRLLIVILGSHTQPFCSRICSTV